MLATSAAWSARLRYALDPIMETLQERAPDIVKVGCGSYRSRRQEKKSDRIDYVS